MSEPRKTVSDDTPEMFLSIKLWRSIKNGGTAAKEPDFQKWSRVFDLMHRIDKRPFHWIHETLAATRKDSFWKDNIKSPAKFREQLNTGKLDKFVPESWLTDEDFLKEMAVAHAA